MHTDTPNIPDNAARQNLQRKPGEHPDVYALVTERIVALLDQGIVPWKQPWTRGGCNCFPKNFVAKRPYTGANVFILGTAGFGSPYFLTYKQAKDLGGFVRKGEQGIPIIYCNTIVKGKRESQDGGETQPERIKFLRYYTVFNLEQCEDIPVPSPDPVRGFAPLEECEAIVKGYRGRPNIVHHKQEAYYHCRLDYINMPRPESFTPPEEYYATLFHEMVHSTGHASRLKREGIDEFHRFGDPVYGKEELIAEMGAAFLSARAAIAPAVMSQSAAYIGGWLRTVKSDKKLVIHAAAAAQRAADYILGLTPQETGLAQGDGDTGTSRT